MKDKIKKFTDLVAWQKAHQLRIRVLLLVKGFPDGYKFGLSSQMQRSAVSVGSNLAEGFGRHGSKERVQFYRIARGSLVELQDQLLVARDINLINKEEFDKLAAMSVTTHKLINGLIRSSKELHQGSKLKAQGSK